MLEGGVHPTFLPANIATFKCIIIIIIIIITAAFELKKKGDG
jgi:hypothetical protein